VLPESDPAGTDLAGSFVFGYDGGMTSKSALHRVVSPDGTRKADIPGEILKEKLREGWTVDLFPDDRGELYAGIPDKHKGRSAIVIASGPSSGIVSRDAVAALIERENLVVFGVNDADRSMGGLPVPKLNYLVILDDHLWDDRLPHLLPLLAANPGSLPITAFTIQEDVRYIYAPFSFVEDPNEKGPANIPYVVGRLFHGWSSGVAAIQIAMWMGCRRIYLLGHDLQVAHGRTHGFGVREAGEKNRNYPQRAKMFAGYETIAYHAAKTGVEIINLSPCSAISFFPVIPLLKP